MAKTKGEGGETRANCGCDARTRFIKPWGPFLESPGNLTGPESFF